MAAPRSHRAFSWIQQSEKFEELLRDLQSTLRPGFRFQEEMKGEKYLLMGLQKLSPLG